jgi:hypothetical protein
MQRDKLSSPMAIPDKLESVDYRALIDTSHPRLSDITIAPTHGSWRAPFPPLILLVPPEQVGTHEETNPPNPITEEDFSTGGFRDINLTDGWVGAPVAVAAHQNGEGNVIYPQIAEALSFSPTGIGVLETLAYGDLFALDGHHRRKRTEHEGLLVPVQVFPFPHPNVHLDTWHDDGRVLSPREVFVHAKNPDSHVEAKRTKFIAVTGGLSRRIRDAQPILHIPKANLRR